MADKKELKELSETLAVMKNADIKNAWELGIHEKLMRIQTELKAPKDQYNDFGKYKYRSAESILEAVKPLLKAYGVSVTLSDTVCEVVGRVYVKSTATLTDSLTGANVAVTAYAREEQSKKGYDEAQLTGACSSYARKYALNGLFLIDDTKDVDTNEYQAQGQQAQAKPKTAKPAPKKAEVPAPSEMPVEVTDSRTELRNFIKANGLDAHAIAEACGLNRESTEQDYADALEYARGLVR